MLPDRLLGVLLSASKLPLTAAPHAIRYGPFPAAWPKEAREELEGATKKLLNAGLTELHSTLRVTNQTSDGLPTTQAPSDGTLTGQDSSRDETPARTKVNSQWSSSEETPLVLQSEEYSEPDGLTRELIKRYKVAAEPKLPYSMLSEVELYPQWMPWCNGTTVTSWNPDRTPKEVEVSFGIEGILSNFSGSIPYHITLVPPDETSDSHGNRKAAQVLAENFGCNYATQLVYDWRFTGHTNEDGQPMTEVDLRLKFVARHKWHMLMWDQMRNQIVNGMAEAFSDRLAILRTAELRKEYIAAEKATDEAFGKIDTNADGKIDRAEWISKYGNDNEFDSFDLDGNGLIDLHEFKQGTAGKLRMTEMPESAAHDSELESDASLHTSSVGYSVTDIMSGPFEVPGQAVIVTEADGHTLRHVNAEFELLTGYRKSEVIGRTIQQLLQGEDTDKPVTSALGRAVRNYLPASARVVNYRKDGSAFLSYLRFEPILDNEQNTGVIYWAVIRDCTASSEGMEAGVSQQLLSQSKGQHSTWATGWC